MSTHPSSRLCCCSAKMVAAVCVAIAAYINAQVEGVSRVVYDLTSNLPARIEWE